MTETIRPSGSPAAWTGRKMSRTPEWIHEIRDTDIAELDAALAGVKARGLGVPDITRADFPLPGFSRSLDAIRREVEDGRGFVLLRGIPVHRYSQEDAERVFWGIGTWWGEAVGQNTMGDVLGHVRDVGRDWNSDHHGRGYQGHDALAFHCDKNDLVALMCWHPAKSGGLSCIASSLAIHDAMLERRPDLLELLYGPFYIDYRGEEMAGEKPYYVQPMFVRHGGRLYARYGRTYVMTSQRFPEVPRLTADQIAAIEMVDALANDDEFRLDMEFRRGDIQLLNNHAILHSRTAYEDWPEHERSRHLFRLLFLTDTFADAPAHYQTVRKTSRYWRDHPRPPAEVAPIVA